MNRLTEKFVEVVRSVLPIALLVLLLHLTVAPLETDVFIRFIIGTLFVVIGLTIFLVGVDISISPIGEYLGKGIAGSNKVWIVVLGGLLLGFFISIAEPSLTVLSNQINTVTGGVVPSSTILIVVSIGIAVMVAIGLLRIVFSVSIRTVLTGAYLLILVLGIFTSNEFMAMAFDASGATTGSVTVPFLLALSTGIAQMKKSSTGSEDDSFGLVGIASSGAIIAVMILSIVSGQDELQGSLEAMSAGDGLFGVYLENILIQIQEVIVSVAPIAIIFMLYQVIFLKLRKQRLRRIIFGLVYVYIGLILFLTGINAGFMDVGSILGSDLASSDNNILLLIVAFGLGMVTILAEPAVSVLTRQIQDITGGSIKRGPITASLSLGVGLAIFLSVVRILVPGMQLWHLLLPGYILAIGLSYIVPKVFIGMAFDAGGVASGPMTATFILAFIQGIAQAVEGASVLVDGFGMIAMVAMMPIITLELFGLIYTLRAKRAGEE